jgi:hypothetical protein
MYFKIVRMSDFHQLQFQIICYIYAFVLTNSLRHDVENLFAPDGELSFIH